VRIQARDPIAATEVAIRGECESLKLPVTQTEKIHSVFFQSDAKFILMKVRYGTLGWKQKGRSKYSGPHSEDAN
jgi:hypothetical protein